MSIRTSFFRKFGLSLFGVFVLNALASFFYWYQSFVWFDMVMHFFGGIVVTFFLVFVFYKTYDIWAMERTFWKAILMNSLIFVLIAVLWEIMEFSVQHAFDIYGALATPADSVSDIFCGLAGSLLALVYYFLKLRSHARN